MKDLKELILGAIIAGLVTLVVYAFIASLTVAIIGGIFAAGFMYLGGGFWYLIMKLKPKNISEDNFMLMIYLGLPIIWMVWMYLSFN